MAKYSTLSEEIRSLHKFISEDWSKFFRIAIALYDMQTDILHTHVIILNSFKSSFTVTMYSNNKLLSQ